MNFDLSIIIPCYNEEKNIAQIYYEIENLQLNDVNLEILFVNNGSDDNTKTEILEILKKSLEITQNLKIRLVNLKHNQNYDGGILSGLKEGNGRFLSWTHGDLQTPLQDVLDLYHKIKDKNKVFGKGTRTNNRGYDGIISRFHEKLSSLILGFKMKEINAQPKMFRKEDLNIFSNPPTNYARLDTYFYYLALKNSFEIVSTEVIFRSRIHGTSNWKSNIFDFVRHLISNILYLIKLRFLSN